VSELPSRKNSVKDLVKEAKWAADPEEQKQSIEQLASHGQQAIPALEEVKTVTAQHDIRKEVEAAIKGIQKEAAAVAAEEETSRTKRMQKKRTPSSRNTTTKKKKTDKSATKKPSVPRKSSRRVTKAKNSTRNTSSSLPKGSRGKRRNR
jgi:hypothetical protein